MAVGVRPQGWGIGAVDGGLRWARATTAVPRARVVLGRLALAIGLHVQGLDGRDDRRLLRDRIDAPQEVHARSLSRGGGGLGPGLGGALGGARLASDLFLRLTLVQAPLHRADLGHDDLAPHLDGGDPGQQVAGDADG